MIFFFFFNQLFFSESFFWLVRPKNYDPAEDPVWDLPSFDLLFSVGLLYRRCFGSPQ